MVEKILAGICVLIMIAWITSSVYRSSNQTYAHDQTPILTPREATCETVTQRNQAQCAGPETKQNLEDCEPYYENSVRALERARKQSDAHFMAAYFAEASAYGVRYQNCLERNKHR